MRITLFLFVTVLFFHVGYSQNKVPIASFVVNKNITTGTNFEYVCDATKSFDPDGYLKSFEWVISGPDIDGGATTVKTATAQFRQVWGCVNGTFIFKLIVYDEKGNRSSVVSRKVKVKFKKTGAGTFNPNYSLKVGKLKVEKV